MFLNMRTSVYTYHGVCSLSPRRLSSGVLATCSLIYVIFVSLQMVHVHVLNALPYLNSQFGGPEFVGIFASNLPTSQLLMRMYSFRGVDI